LLAAGILRPPPAMVAKEAQEAGEETSPAS
jgi:hypothetical protein